MVNSADIRLVVPTLDMKEKALEFKQKFFDAGENVIDGSEMLDLKDTYEEWLSYVTDIASEETVPEGWVLIDTYFALNDEDKIVGIIDFRHELNDFFRDFGHTGYSVLPEERRKGYAKKMLSMIADKAKEAGLERLQLAVLRSNIASVKTILANGGVVARSFEQNGLTADVYYIEL